MSRRSVPLPQGSNPTHAGLQWTERFNCYRTVVAGWLVLEFSWSSDGYAMAFAGQSLKNKAKSPEEAATTLVRTAAGYMRKALDVIDPKPPLDTDGSRMV